MIIMMGKSMYCFELILKTLQKNTMPTPLGCEFDSIVHLCVPSVRVSRME